MHRADDHRERHTTNEGADYTSGTWTNEGVKVTFNAQDNEGGSGLKDISYLATGAQSIAETLYDEQHPPVISAEGTTTVSYFATDNDSNRETPDKTLTVELDKGAPTVSTTTPTSGAKGVRRNTILTADFSDGVSGKMDPASITTATFKLYRCPSTTSTNCTKQITNVAVALEFDLNATLDPFGTSSTLLASRTKYKAVVTTGAADVAGNGLDQQQVWYFTTGKR